jgi:protein-tyrosine phosphatase
MSGVTAYGNKHFDVPFMTEIIPGLWQGGCEDDLLLPTKIEHLVSLYPWERYNVNHDLATETTITMYDADTGVDVVNVFAIAAWVTECMRQGATLVHCQAGLNRSSLIVGTVLVKHGGIQPRDAIDLIREQRSSACLCNTSFERFILSLSPGLD